ncbi:MAG: carbon-nitrogen hydrolase family protein [Candidatus Omnitrophica bacterium]|nr:carbon-nitrogen hydrolase family protein [Candidatus Omnitrophota bacterium]
MEDIKIAAISMRSRPANPEENFKRHIEWIERAAEHKVDWCLFPEMSITGFCFDRSFFETSEYFNGPSTRKMIEAAKKFNVTIGFGIAERDEGDLIRNTYVFVSPDGLLGRYRKTHIPPLEYSIETSADDFIVIETKKARVGVNICFDNWFCESARLSYLNGAEIIIAPFYMSWGPDNIKTNPLKAYDDWRELALINFRAAAWQNGVYHITINSCGPVNEKGVEYYGVPLVMVINPFGEIEAETKPGQTTEQMVVHTLKAETIVKRRSDSLFHPRYRRPHIYKKISL